MRVTTHSRSSSRETTEQARRSITITSKSSPFTQHAQFPHDNAQKRQDQQQQQQRVYLRAANRPLAHCAAALPANHQPTPAAAVRSIPRRGAMGGSKKRQQRVTQRIGTRSTPSSRTDDGGPSPKRPRIDSGTEETPPGQDDGGKEDQPAERTCPQGGSPPPASQPVTPASDRAPPGDDVIMQDVIKVSQEVVPATESTPDVSQPSGSSSASVVVAEVVKERSKVPDSRPEDHVVEAPGGTGQADSKWTSINQPGNSSAAAVDGTPTNANGAVDGTPKKGKGAVSGTPKKGKGAVNGTPKKGKGAVSGTPKKGKGAVSGTPKKGKGAVSGTPKKGKGAVSGTPKKGKGAVNGTPKKGKGAGASTQRKDKATTSKELGEIMAFVPRLLITSTPATECAKLLDFERPPTMPNPIETLTDPDRIRAALKSRRDAAYPPGVHVLHTWTSSPGKVGDMAAYVGFKSINHLIPFVDNVLPDINARYLRLFTGKWTNDEILALGADNPPPEVHSAAFRELLEQARKSLTEAAEPEKARKLNWVCNKDCMVLFHSSSKIRTLVNTVVAGCNAPTFLPVTESMVSVNESGTGAINAHATIIVAAVQLLMFAPVDWTFAPRFDFTRRDYRTFFPSPPVCPSETTEIGDVYSREDLNRSLAMHSLSRYRRMRGADKWLGQRNLPSSQDQFHGYVDEAAARRLTKEASKETDENNVVMQQSMALIRSRRMDPSQSGAMFLMQNNFLADIVDADIDKPAPANDDESRHDTHDTHDAHNMMALAIINQQVAGRVHQHGGRTEREGSARSGLGDSSWAELVAKIEAETLCWSDMKDQHARIARQLTTYSTNSDATGAYAREAMQSNVVLEFLASHPDRRDELEQRIMQASGFEQISGDTVSRYHNKIDMEAAAKEYSMHPNADFTEFHLYPKEYRARHEAVMPMKPHQAADVFDMMKRVRNGEPVMLCNEMGIGKTFSFLALVEVHARHLENLEGRETLMPWERLPSSFNPERPYLPTLIVSPKNIIEQTVTFAQEQFPGFTLFVYYSDKSSFSIKGCSVIGRREFTTVMETLRADAHKPATARTILFTTPGTLSKRELRVTNQWVMIGRKLPKPKKSARKDDEQPQASSASEPVPGGEPDTPAGYETPEQALRRLRKYGHVAPQKPDPRLVDGRKRFFEDDKLRNRPPLYELPDDNAVNRDGVLVTYDYQPGRDALELSTFRFAILDEAHTCKKLNGQYNHLVRKTSYRHLVWVTGTPLASSLSDLNSPLLLMWRNLKIDGLADWRDLTVDPGQYADKEQGVWSSVKDPWRHWVKSTEGEGGAPPAVAADVDVLSQALDESGFNILALNPWLYAGALRAGGSSSSFGQDVSRAVLDMISIRRRLRTELTLPGGKKVWPAPDLLPMEVNMVEVEHAPHIRGLIKRHGEGIHMRAHTDNHTDNDNANIETERSDPVTFGLVRRGVLAAHDHRHLLLLQSRPEDSLPVGVDVKSIFQHLARKNTKRVSVNDPVGDQPVVGVEHVRRLASRSTGVLGYFYDKVYMDPAIPSLTSPLQWLVWSIYGSPILAAVLLLLKKHVRDEQRRVVIYVDTPWIQALLFAQLQQAGFNVNTVRSGDNPSLRAEQMRGFVEAVSDVEVFIANIHVMATGVNLHPQCYTGYTVNWHYNCSIMRQVHSRLDRLGQKRQVEWFTIKARGSFHDLQERNCMTKATVLLSADAAIPNWLTAAMRDVVLWEILKSYWRSPFNRFAWVLAKELSDDEFDMHGEGTVRLGHLISLLAKLLLVCSEREQDFFRSYDDVLLPALGHITDLSIADLEDYLAAGEAMIRQEFLSRFRSAAKEARAAAKRDVAVKAKFESIRQRTVQRDQARRAALDRSADTILDEADNTEAQETDVDDEEADNSSDEGEDGSTSGDE
ncbi:snf2 family helicase [Beauveria brongniartii RCEF 3172]|uniref:Snf2 family helicase n=1 Tax=Beauveria brongniartii RCEF 3172 TaxID=1081107 RepID=A0A162IXC3_9HYPO|nr:snf2 family helicase [Beauveria brongniartii RCEF 3172]